MADKKVIMEVKDVDNALYGCSGGKETYTPEVFAEMGIPEEKWFSMDTEPMSDKDCSIWRTINAKIGVDVALNRTGERGDKIAEIRNKIKIAIEDNDKATLGDILESSELAFWSMNQDYENSLDDIEKKFELVYPYLSNLQNHREESLTPEVWATMPNRIRAYFYNKVILRSNVSSGESLNLL